MKPTDSLFLGHKIEIFADFCCCKFNSESTANMKFEKPNEKKEMKTDVDMNKFK